MSKPCHGTDHGYICHLAQLCRHVTPEATTSDAMKCSHLGFEQFISHPMTTYGAISKARHDAARRGIPELEQALKREYERMTSPKGQAVAVPQAALIKTMPMPPIGQTFELFA
jgi:hypothetical protein